VPEDEYAAVGSRELTDFYISNDIHWQFFIIPAFKICMKGFFYLLV
jgi:hypothetical protein